MASARKPTIRSSPRERGVKATRKRELNSPLCGNERQGASAALYRLMAWLSPAYPVGAFAYSSGLEWAIEAGDVTSVEALHGWLATLLADGAGFCDAVFSRTPIVRRKRATITR